ncbi:hypothetical protein V8F33_010186 [Rhypophila sp. PSN 637]
MIGLEEVKQAFISVKSKVYTTLKQGISFNKDRYGCAMLGNPGTGKTTVARLYAQFLMEVGVIPGPSQGSACHRFQLGDPVSGGLDSGGDVGVGSYREI